jgi:hypothetical protein
MDGVFPHYPVLNKKRNTPTKQARGTGVAKLINFGWR